MSRCLPARNASDISNVEGKNVPENRGVNSSISSRIEYFKCKGRVRGSLRSSIFLYAAFKTATFGPGEFSNLLNIFFVSF